MFKKVNRKGENNKYWVGLGGFTLLELVAVIIIIGILASIALPKYNEVVEKSRSAEAKMGLKAILNSETAYALQWGNYTGGAGTQDKLTDINVSSYFPAKYFTFAISGASFGGTDEVVVTAVRLNGPRVYTYNMYESENLTCSPVADCPQ